MKGALLLLANAVIFQSANIKHPRRNQVGRETLKEHDEMMTADPRTLMDSARGDAGPGTVWVPCVRSNPVRVQHDEPIESGLDVALRVAKFPE